MNRLALTVVIATFAAASAYCMSSNAKELSGTYTPEQVKASCDKVGGEYFPQGQTGTFGCENHDNGNMVLCNKEGKCTGYVATRTQKENDLLVKNLRLRPAMATATKSK
jgi:hypothetical protein